MWMEPGTIQLPRGEIPRQIILSIRAKLCIPYCSGPVDFTDIAFPYGAVYTREELKKREKDQLELLANRLQSDLQALSLQSAVASSAVVAEEERRKRQCRAGHRATIIGTTPRYQTRGAARH